MIMTKICDYPIIHNATGFGLYDKKIIDHLKTINDPYPFLRGLVSELGYPIKTIEFIQDIRRQDKSKNNFTTLYQFAIFSIVSQSTFPIRFISLVGFSTAIISLITLILYIFLKLSYWYEYPTGLIPAICLITLFFSILLTILGIFGEYLLVMLAHLKNRPIVIESERVNFNDD
jgi:dolichol-phosphate mannosyltransferase